MRQALALVFLLVLLPAIATAHQGPPFPIRVDQSVGPYRASVWTDPDIGTGTFFVVLEPPEGAPDRPLPHPSAVRVAVQPTSGRLPEAVYTAVPQKVSYGERYFAAVPFDRGEMWKVRIEIRGPQGGGDLHAEVEATPDGTIGPIGIVVYSFPFLAMGFLWWKAARRRNQAGPAASPRGEPGPGG